MLFVGDSFTYENELPSLVRGMLRSDRDPLPALVVEYTRPGGRLEQAAADGRLTHLLLDVPWNFVVLQEQSEIPSFPALQRERLMADPVRDLVFRIRASGAVPVLFETWGYRDGDKQNVATDSYWAMQARLDHGYHSVAAEVGATVAPVGEAWNRAFEAQPNIDLWADDGKHPSRLGSLLAASIFYELFTQSAPTNLSDEGLPPRDAAFLVRVARSFGGAGDRG